LCNYILLLVPIHVIKISDYQRGTRRCIPEQTWDDILEVVDIGGNTRSRVGEMACELADWIRRRLLEDLVVNGGGSGE